MLGLPAWRRAQPTELTPSMYAGWIARYRRGGLEEVLPEARNRRTYEVLSVQRRYLAALGQSEIPRRDLGEHHPLHVFQATLATAMFHAELGARFGANWAGSLRLVGAPLQVIPRRWPPFFPGDWREAAHEAWGEERTRNPRALLRREIFLMVARSHLARLDNRTTRQVLKFASPHRDPAVAWQFAATDIIQARYLRDELWSEAERGLRRGVEGWEWSPADTAASRRTIVRAMGDPDDWHLRLALVALGRRRYRAAAFHLEMVRAEVAPRLRVPRLLLQAELDLRELRPRSATRDLPAAVRVEPTSPAGTVALVAALQAAGRWDEAAALASEFLSVGEKVRPWLGFITTWAKFGEGLPWLRQVAGIA